MALPYCIPYFDAHCDTLTRFRRLRRSGKNHLDLTRLGHYAPAAQVLALWAPPGLDGETYFRRLMLTADRELAANKDIASLCVSAAEADAAAKDDKIALFLSVEGANLLGCSVAGLLDAYRRGVRMVTLCWNRDNRLCGSAKDSGSGLTADGKRFVAACWEKGVAVDLSHASEQTFWDVMRMAERPVLCSHSNAKSICDHPRNLTDAQISAIVRNDGCIGLNLCPDFLGRGRNVDAILAHVDHFLCMDARENLCLGTDFDGVDELPEGISGVESMETLYEEMLRHRFSEGLVQDIFYNNLHRFMENAL